jgi:hypothetical protein
MTYFTLLDYDEVFLPEDTGMVRLIEAAIETLLTQKLYTEVNPLDLSRAVVIKSGKEQQAPTYCTVLIHKNDPINAAEWAHEPEVKRRSRTTDREGRYPREFINGGTLYQRAFTVEVKTMLRKVIGAITITQNDADNVCQTCLSRAASALRAGGPDIGTDQAIEDSFGEATYKGPHFGSERVTREQGKGLRAQGKLQIWYGTYRN